MAAAVRTLCGAILFAALAAEARSSPVARGAEDFGRLALSGAFEASTDRDGSRRFELRGAGMSTSIQDGGIVHRLTTATGCAEQGEVAERYPGGVVRPVADAGRVVRVSRFVGPDPAAWRSSTGFEAIDLGEVWQGIRVVVESRARGHERTFVVSPGARPERIRMAFDGADSLDLRPDGTVAIDKCGQSLRLSAPVAWQVVEGRRVEVDVSHRVSGRQVSFRVGRYDTRYALWIDPILVGTYFSSATGSAEIMDLKVGPDGSFYVLYAMPNGPPAFDRTPTLSMHGGEPTTIARVSADLTRVLALAQIGSLETYDPHNGTHEVFHASKLLVANASLYVGGTCLSATFPTPGGAQTEPYRNARGFYFYDGCIARLSLGLDALLSGSYLSGGNEDRVRALAAGPDGSIYVGGHTNSADLPSVEGSAAPVPLGVFTTGFVTRFSADLGRIDRSAYTGGFGDTSVDLLAIDAAGRVFAAGTTTALTDATAAGGAQPHSGSPPHRGGMPGADTPDAYVTRFEPTLTGAARSTFIGGTLEDTAAALALAPDGSVYVAGNSLSESLPSTEGSVQPFASKFLRHAFVSRLSNDLSRFIRNTHLGALRGFGASDLVIEPEGTLLVAGAGAFHEDFPPLPPAASEYDLPADNLVRLSADLAGFVKVAEVGLAYAPRIALDNRGAVFIYGELRRDAMVPQTTGTVGPVNLGPPAASSSSSFVVRATLDLEGMGGPGGPIGEVLPGTNVYFGAVKGGAWSPTAYVEVHNAGNAPLVVSSIYVEPVDPTFASAEVSGGTCVVGALLPPGAMCTIGLRILANSKLAPGRVVICHTGALDCTHLRSRLAGLLPSPYALRPTAIEYYHAAYDHYFVTADPAEIAALDDGTFPGWRRTGGGFQASVDDLGAPPLVAPVCRYYIPMETTSSHFYSADAVECALLPSLYPWFVLESTSAMHVFLPADDGTCLLGVPVFRFWNARHDTNHRLTTDPAVRDHMLRRGWVAEGVPPSQAAMCVWPH